MKLICFKHRVSGSPDTPEEGFQWAEEIVKSVGYMLLGLSLGLNLFNNELR